MERRYVSREVGKREILVVDDDNDAVFAIEQSIPVYCKNFDRIYSVGDGNSAIDKWMNEHPDVIVLDVMLPQRSGFLVLEKIRHKEEFKEWPYIVMITANPGLRYRTWAECLGADDYINKPFKMERLMESVQKGLDRKY